MRGLYNEQKNYRISINFNISYIYDRLWKCF